MTYIQDTEQNKIVNETMRMWTDKSFPKEFGFKHSTKRYEKYEKLRKFREFWFIRCFGLDKQSALEAFLNDEKTRPEEVRQVVDTDNKEVIS